MTDNATTARTGRAIARLALPRQIVQRRTYALVFLLVSAAAIAQSPERIAQVTRVSDGDSIAVKQEDGQRVRIRLQGIDAPERTMAYSQVSRRHLAELVLGKTVRFIPEKVDRHGRIVAVVRLEDGTDICLAQIQAGLAWHFKRYELEQTPHDRAAYAEAETIARADRRGLWRADKPMPPWDFRALFRREEIDESHDKGSEKPIPH